MGNKKRGIPRSEGRALFGLNPAGYDAARPGYPARLYEMLQERCGLAQGARTLEVGAGSGQATRELLKRGADPLVAVEPDRTLAERLPGYPGDVNERVRVIVDSLEDADLPSAYFDLAVAATSFHWVTPEIGLTKVREALRPGGARAMWWNVFGDPERADAFHDATNHLMEPLPRSPSGGDAGRPPFALDVEQRKIELSDAGFVGVEHTVIRWPLYLDADGVRALYGTFSGINVLRVDDRERTLDAIADIARTEFGDRVERNMITVAYTARRPEA